jgi:hypothetical protein
MLEKYLDRPLHKNAAAVVVPTLRKGKLVRGPEPWIGCYNTGHAPTILRSRWDGLFYVGEEIAIDALKEQRLYASLRHQKEWRSNQYKEKGFARCFKTRKPALEQFRQLVSAALHMRDESVEEERKEREALVPKELRELCK